jgi:hypothetical protein
MPVSDWHAGEFGSGRREVAIPPHLKPAIEKHLREHVDARQDALLFPADQGGHQLV